MGITTIPAGKAVPEDIYAHVEVPQGSNVKYEIDEESGVLMVDRFVHTPMVYPMNYAYIPQTLANDGDAIDVLIPTPEPLIPGCVIRCRPVGVLIMEDESGMDEKIIAVPHHKVNPRYDEVQELSDLPKFLVEQVTYFFEHYKDMNPEKWVKVQGMEGKEKAFELINEGVARYSK
jgi:inorganic pyrophosphatase